MAYPYGPLFSSTPTPPPSCPACVVTVPTAVMPAQVKQWLLANEHGQKVIIGLLIAQVAIMTLTFVLTEITRPFWRSSRQRTSTP